MFEKIQSDEKNRICVKLMRKLIKIIKSKAIFWYYFAIIGLIAFLSSGHIIYACLFLIIFGGIGKLYEITYDTGRTERREEKEHNGDN